MTRFNLDHSKRLGSLLDFATISLGKLRPDYSVERGPRPEGTSWKEWDASQPKKMDYPSLWLSDRDQSLAMPTKGTALIKYRVKRHSVTNETENGKVKRRESADIEIQSIDPNVSGRAKKVNFSFGGGAISGGPGAGLTAAEKRRKKEKLKESGGAIRKIGHLVGLSAPVRKPFKIDLEAVMNRVSFESVNRNRNSGGQFSPGQEAPSADVYTAAIGKKKPEPGQGKVKPGALTDALPALGGGQ